eukprot:TRINITY_DN4746_c0_g1_i3.p1 TRINITY_DN4746_c0_g1~~TRINITY_DN4746_c0_g1_i3.p1  ORF type:complete len:394 (+),score=55.56 TRINITY_DN4746_c0_g1_i3:2058-3239(+)
MPYDLPASPTSRSTSTSVATGHHHDFSATPTSRYDHSSNKVSLRASEENLSHLQFGDPANSPRGAKRKAVELSAEKETDEYDSEEREEQEDEEEEQHEVTAKYNRSQASTMKSISGEAVNIGNSEILKMWEIKLEELVVGDQLGAGAFGSVCRGTWRGSKVAIKMLHKQDEGALKMFFKEVQLMCKIRHAHIVQYYGVCMHPSRRCLVMEFLPQSLAQLLRKGPLDASLFVSIAKGVAQGMNYLHCSNIIHRDLKPSNILLDSFHTPKLCDFGVSRESEATATMTGLGTPLYMAPEMLHNRHYGPKVDVYAFAMILWQMQTGRRLMEGFGFRKKDVTPIQIALQVCMKQLRPAINVDTMPTHILTLILQCWDDDPNNRPTFAQILELLENFPL